MDHQGVMFLTPARNAQASGFSLFDQVRVSDIAWVEEYKIGKGKGSMVLLNNGTFRCYLQSAEFIKRSACCIIGRMAMAGAPVIDAPWIME